MSYSSEQCSSSVTPFQKDIVSALYSSLIKVANPMAQS